MATRTGTRRTIRRYALGGFNRAGNLDAENVGALWVENLLPSSTGGLVLRQGYKAAARIGWQYASGFASVGCMTAHLPDAQIVARTVTPELLISTQTTTAHTSGGLIRARVHTFTIASSGALRLISIEWSGTEWAFIVRDTNSATLFTLGLGAPWSATVTLANLKTAVDGAGVSLTLTLPTTLANTNIAVFTHTMKDLYVAASGSATFDMITVDDGIFVSEGPTTSLGLLAHACYNARYIPKTLLHGVQFQNRTWFRDVWRLRKYDGKNAFPAGVRAPLQATLTPGTAGSIADGNYRYGLTFSIKDAQGYEVESDLYEAGTVTIAGADDDVTISNIQGRGGWVPAEAGMASLVSNGWGAVCSSTMGAPGVTVTCATYQKLDAGDPVYLYDRATSAFVERYVVSATATTVTVDSNIQINSGDAMSPVRVNVYRSKVGPSSLYYFVNSYAADISNPTQGIQDIKADASLGFAYTFPIVAHTPPPTQLNTSFTPATEDESGSFPIDVYQNSLYLGNLYDDRGAVAFSDTDFPEHFPEANVLRPGEGRDDITALKATQDFLLIFTKNDSYILTGNPVEGTGKVQRLGPGVGCSSQASAADCGGTVYWCSEQGVFRSRGGMPEKISAPIQYFFRQASSDENSRVVNTQLRADRAVGVYLPEQNQYRIFMPVLRPLDSVYGSGGPSWGRGGLRGWGGGSLTAGTKTISLCFVFDIGTEQWFAFSQVDFTLGAVMFNDTLLGVSVGDSGGATRRTYLTRRIERLDKYAAIDDDLGDGTGGGNGKIPWAFQSRYDSLSLPGILKRVLRMRIEAYNDFEAAAFSGSAATTLNYNYTRPASSSSTAHSYVTTFPITTTQPDYKWRLKPGRCRSISFEVFGNPSVMQFYEKVALTGVELEFAESYRQVFKEPNG